jgi:putative hemolysin
MSQGTQSGAFEAAEQDLVKRVFRFGDRRARAMMTPRNKVVWIDVADTPEEVQAKIVGSPHSRFPVCDQSLDNLIGFIHVKDLLCHAVDDDLFRVKGRLTIPLFIYEGTRGLKLLELFKRSSARVAVILDEFGTVDGLLTLTDILEAIVGDMPESGEDESAKSFERSDGSWVLDATMPIDDFRDLYDMASLPDADFHTLAGLVVYLLGHIPRVGESVESFGLHFDVVDMDGNRVNKVMVKRLGGRDNDL